MKIKKYLHLGLVLAFILALALSGCGGGNSGGPGGGTTYTPGQQSPAYSVGGVTFYMRYAPSGSFTSDDKTISEDLNLPGPVAVANAYWMAETEVTYQLWKAVHTWAKGGHGYTFAYDGREGDDGLIGDLPIDASQEPVTTVSWRDAMVWCNALTEYYYGNSDNCVYYSDATYATPLRSVDNGPVVTTAGGQDNPYVKPTAKGFRLPTSNEWQLAARYQNGSTWTAGNHVSGDITGNCFQDPGTSTVFSNYAWYSANSNSHTHPVGEKTANALNIKDMSGNVWEWCFDWHPSFVTNRVLRGGSWYYVAYRLQLGYVYYGAPDLTLPDLGFRPVRTQ